MTSTKKSMHWTLNRFPPEQAFYHFGGGGSGWSFSKKDTYGLDLFAKEASEGRQLSKTVSIDFLDRRVLKTLALLEDYPIG